MIRQHLFGWIAVSSCMLLLVSCGGGGSSDPEPPSPPRPSTTYSITINSVSEPATTPLRIFADISVAWQITASPASSSSVAYTITSSDSRLRIPNASGSVTPGTTVTTQLRYKCSEVGTRQTTATISVGGVSQVVETSVACIDRVRLEVFQGPLIATVEFTQDGTGWSHTTQQTNFYDEEILRLLPHRQAFVAVVSEHSESERITAILDIRQLDDNIVVEQISSSTVPPRESTGRLNYVSQTVFSLEGAALDTIGDLEFSVSSADVEGDTATFALTELERLEAPHFNLVFIPIRAEHGEFQLEDPEAYVAVIEDLLPIGRISYRVREALDMRDIEWDFSIDETPLIHLFELWIEESSRNEFYHGLFKVDEGSRLCGIGLIGHPVGMTQENSSSCSQNTIAHEIGHNLLLQHAPACGAEDVDPDSEFPYSDGSIGTEGGWFMNLRRSVGASAIGGGRHFDVMSYCIQTFVSQYSYGLAFDYWSKQEGAPIVASNLPKPIAREFDIVEGKSWVVTGRVRVGSSWSVSKIKEVDRDSHRFAMRKTDYEIAIQDVPSGLVLHQENIQLASLAHGSEDFKFWGARLPFYSSDNLLLLISDLNGNVVLEQPLQEFNVR